MRKLVIGIVVLTLVMSATAVLSASAPKVVVPKVGPNYMGFSDSPKTVKVGSTFTMTVYADIHSQIDTCAIDKMTFLPAGIINYKSVAKGNLFSGSIVWLTPSKYIDNAKGTAYPIVWANMPRVNNVKKNFAVITFTAMKVGTATITITAGGTAGNGIDPGTTKYVGIVNVVKK